MLQNQRTLTKFQIMQQAGVAALGQAKAIPQSVLFSIGILSHLKDTWMKISYKNKYISVK